jgi:hypothetical protein
VLRVTRQRDHVGFFRLRGPHDYDYLIHVFQSGGPGTCVWAEFLVVYRIEDDSTALTTLQTLPTGGYLRCADASSRSCGCGTWTSTFTARTTRQHAVLVIHSRVAYRDPKDPPVPAPADRTVTLQ